MKLRVVFHVASAAGGLTATLDSPDQGAYGIPVDHVEYTAPTLRIDASKRGVRYEGKLEGARLTGTFTQGKDFPLVLDRVAESAVQAHKRPQLPKRPFPYREEEVQVTVPERYGTTRANVLIKLAGTLSLPPGKGPFPAVLFITGSGPEDRDETIFDHKPFLVLSDALARAGIDAALRRSRHRPVGQLAEGAHHARSGRGCSRRARLSCLTTRGRQARNRPPRSLGGWSHRADHRRHERGAALPRAARRDRHEQAATSCARNKRPSCAPPDGATRTLRTCGRSTSKSSRSSSASRTRSGSRPRSA